MSTVTDAHREWIAEALAAPFETPRRIPTLGRVKVRTEPLPDLFRDILDALDAPSEPETPTPVGMSPGELLRSHFGEALPGPSAHTLKRRALKRQRVEAEAKVQPEPVAAAPDPAPPPRIRWPAS